MHISLHKPTTESDIIIITTTTTQTLVTVTVTVTTLVGEAEAETHISDLIEFCLPVTRATALPYLTAVFEFCF